MKGRGEMGTHCTFHRRKQFQKSLNLRFLQYICVTYPISTTAELDKLFKSTQERVNLPLQKITEIENTVPWCHVFSGGL